MWNAGLSCFRQVSCNKEERVVLLNMSSLIQPWPQLFFSVSLLISDSSHGKHMENISGSFAGLQCCSGSRRKQTHHQLLWGLGSFSLSNFYIVLWQMGGLFCYIRNAPPFATVTQMYLMQYVLQQLENLCKPSCSSGISSRYGTRCVNKSAHCLFGGLE